MIVPRTRLLVWVAFVVLPFATLGPLVPGGMLIANAVFALFLLAVILDAARAKARLAGVAIELPALVRMQKDQPATLELRIRNEGKTPGALRLGLALPREISSEFCDQAAELPADVEWSRIEWAVKPLKRGRWVLDRVFVEAASPFGWWAARVDQSAHSELRVYPNLIDERKSVSAIFLRRQQVGSRALRRPGQGREFEKLREYQSGDSTHDVHWKATAKRALPVTKVFQTEQTQEVYVILDASRLSARTVAMEDGAETTALERYVTAALIMALAAEQQGDQFGLVTFSDRVLSFVRARNGQAHYDACRDRLYTLQPQLVAPDFEELCTFIRLRMRKRALLIFLTALDDPMLAQQFSLASELLSRQHLIFVNMLAPPGANPLFSTDDVAANDDVYARLGGHLRWQALRELEKNFRRRGMRLGQLDAVRLSAQLVAQLADVKARQLL